MHELSADEPTGGAARRPAVSDTQQATLFMDQAMPHVDALYNGARRMTSNRFDAEDLLQETMLKAYAGFAHYTQGTNLRAWLFRVMYNTWVSEFRRKQSRPAEVLTDEFGDWQLAAESRHSSVGLRSAEVEALERMADHEIVRALDDLPVENRMALYFADVEGMRYRDIASLMGTPVGTVMSRLYRGRRRLRQVLADVARDRGLGPSTLDQGPHRTAG